MSEKVFESFSYLDNKTGNVSYRYTYGGKNCDFFTSNSNASKQLLGLYLIRADLIKTIEWMKIIKEDFETIKTRGKAVSADKLIDKSITRAIFIANLITYGKCFTSTKGRQAKLDESDVPEDFKRTHQIWMQYRHEYAAHSGEAGFEPGVVNIPYSQRNGSGEAEIFAEFRQPSLIWTNPHLPSPLELAEEMYEVINIKIGKKKKLIIDKELPLLIQEKFNSKPIIGGVPSMNKSAISRLIESAYKVTH